jgi:hypothetical protein
MAVEPPPAQPLNISAETAIATLLRAIMKFVLPGILFVIVFGLVDIYGLEHQMGRGVPQSPHENCLAKSLLPSKQFITTKNWLSQSSVPTQLLNVSFCFVLLLLNPVCGTGSTIDRRAC